MRVYRKLLLFLTAPQLGIKIEECHEELQFIITHIGSVLNPSFPYENLPHEDDPINILLKRIHSVFQLILENSSDIDPILSPKYSFEMVKAIEFFNNIHFFLGFETLKRHLPSSFLDCKEILQDDYQIEFTLPILITEVEQLETIIMPLYCDTVLGLVTNPSSNSECAQTVDQYLEEMTLEKHIASKLTSIFNVNNHVQQPIKRRLKNRNIVKDLKFYYNLEYESICSWKGFKTFIGFFMLLNH